MSHPLLSELPHFDRNLLRAIEKIVPLTERQEWSRTWNAELWHLHHRCRTRTTGTLGLRADISIGLTSDALWLRTESWRLALTGSPLLSLASLLGPCMLSALIALLFDRMGYPASHLLPTQFERSLLAAPLVLFVALATASSTHSHETDTGRRRHRIKRNSFLFTQTSLIFLLTFLLSSDACRPIHASLPQTADLLQILFFVIFSLVGLRWGFRDREERCKQCLHSLATPARVGRPSHNLLEWNGTELACKQGHGHLSVPEMESSWCQSSKWVDLSPTPGGP